MTRSRIHRAIRLVLGTTCAVITVPVPHVALAQQTSGGAGLEEIVVTAQRRSESLQDVPLSIAALGSEQMESMGITSVASLMSGQVPSVQMRPFAGNQSIIYVTIRGFSNPNGADILNENPVPIYIDDIYYGRPTSIAMELSDMERIEVLRGPQGTLFGKNSAGGTIRVVSKD